MPATSKRQFKMIQAKRTQYGSKSDAPEEFKWVFDPEWTEGVDYDSLPEASTPDDYIDVDYLSLPGEVKIRESIESDLSVNIIIDIIMESILLDEMSRDNVHKFVHGMDGFTNTEKTKIVNYILNMDYQRATSFHDLVKQALKDLKL